MIRSARRGRYGPLVSADNEEINMKWFIPLGAGVVILTTALIAHTFSGAASREPAKQDPVLAGFERNLNYEPTQPSRVLRSSIEQDELYEMLNRVHWSRPNPTSNDTKGVTEDDQTDN